MNWQAFGDMASWVSAVVALGVAIDTRMRVEGYRRERRDSRLWLTTGNAGALPNLDAWLVHLRFQADAPHTRFRAEVEGLSGLKLALPTERRNAFNEALLEPSARSARRLRIDMSVTGGIQATQFFVWPGQLRLVRVRVSIVDQGSGKRVARRTFDLA